MAKHTKTGQHATTGTAAGTPGYTGRHRASTSETGGFRPGKSERFERLDAGAGEWFTER